MKYCNEIGFTCKSKRNLTDNFENWTKVMRGKVEAAQRTGHGKRKPLTDKLARNFDHPDSGSSSSLADYTLF